MAVMTTARFDRRFDQMRARLARLIDGPKKPGRKPLPLPPGVKSRPPKQSRPQTPVYDGERYATLACGVVIQIDPIDAPLLTFGGWRYKRGGVFCQTTDPTRRYANGKGKRIYHTLAGQIFLAMGTGKKFSHYKSGDNKDLRRSNLSSKPGRSLCPFTADELRALYWEQGLSLAAIGARVPVRAGKKPPRPGTVRRWLVRAGIERAPRSRKSAQPTEKTTEKSSAKSTDKSSESKKS